MKQERGNVAIEMAFSLPLFLFMLLAIIEVNRYFWMGYLLDYQLHQAVKSEAWEPGIGVKTRLEQNLSHALFDPTKISFNEKSASIGQLLLAEYSVSYHTSFYFLPRQKLILHSVSWLGDSENDII